MPSEIEHKYLVLKEAWTPRTSGVLYRQGYLSSTKERVVRVRIAGDRAYLTVKGPTTGVTRLEEREMFGKFEDENDRVAPLAQKLRCPAAMHSAEQAATDQASSISRGMTVVGKIFGETAVQLFGRIEGELRALTVLINEGAQVEGDVVAEELIISGQVKGTIHANRVKLNSSAVVEGDIFHRSLSIEENARFEGSSKREDNAVDVPRTPLRRSATQDHLQTDVAAIEENRKSNGTPNYEANASA